MAATAGRIVFEGEDIGNLRVEDVVSRGIVQVPEGREIFTAMSVEDNLTLGAWRLDWRHGNKRRNRDELERVYALFPRLRERAAQYAGTLSGGEQQMLMIGRALMAKPKLLMLDEPSLGLSPILVQQVFDIIRTIHRGWRRHPAGGAECARRARRQLVRLHSRERRDRPAGAGGRARENPQVHEAYLGGGRVIRH